MATETLTEAEAAEAPALSATPKPIANPVLDDSGIKSMSAKFRELYPVKAPDPAVEPGATQLASAPKTEPVAKPAAVAEPAKADAPAPAEDPDIPPADHAGPLTRQNWKKLHDAKSSVFGQYEKTKKELEAAVAKQKELEAEIGKVKTTVPQDIEDLRKAAAEKVALAEEYKKLLEKVETTNLENSPRFQNWWKTETEKHLKIAERHVPTDKRETLKKLLMETASSERDAAIDEIIEPLSNTSKRLINGAMEQLELVKITREESLERGSENWNKLQEAERQERLNNERQATQAKQRIADAALTKARQMSAFQPIQGDEEHNSGIAQREAFIKACVDGKIDEEIAVSMPAAAVEYLHLTNKVIPAKDAKIASLEKMIRELQSASPAPSGGTSSQKAASDAKPGTSFQAAVSKLMRG